MNTPANNEASRVTIVTVSYNSSTVLGEMLGSCPKECAITIVDNASHDLEKVRELSEKFNAFLIENTKNIGFGRACNKGAEHVNSEFLLFLNPDATLNSNAIENLIATAERHPNASAFNPRIANADGAPSFKRKSDLVDRSEYMPRGWPDNDCELSVLSGAALFVRTKAFNQVRGFDPNIFLFYEDDDLSARLRSECGPLMLSHQAMITHIGGESSDGPKIDSERFKSWHTGFSKVYAMRKHNRPFARSKALLEAIVRVFSPIVMFSRMRRAKRFAFLKGVLTGSFKHLPAQATSQL